MPKRRFHLPSPALVVAAVALFASLGGTSFAATRIISSHGDKKADTKLIKKLAPTLSVKHAKTANSAKTAANATHATSADNATNATNSSSADVATGQGTLRSGASESGIWASSGGAASNYPSAAISFSIPLAAPLDNAHTIYVSGASATHCSGLGHADPGYLCVYQGEINNLTFLEFLTPGGAGTPSASGGASADGAVMYFTFSAAMNYADGRWTVTAP
jgi:hypothetical protein